MQQRQTIQKQLIVKALEKLKHVKGHLSIDEIYSAVREEYDSISKMTVYRNVRQLAASGMIMQIILDDGIERYDLNTHAHHHFTCTKCETIYDVEIEELPEFSQQLQDAHGFEMEVAHLFFTGVCDVCKAKKQ
ncbi:MAG: transcriptional repressor [Turicibacter sp.]|nr:transcriptional repressor [Turicibacter sp.]